MHSSFSLIATVFVGIAAATEGGSYGHQSSSHASNSTTMTSTSLPKYPPTSSLYSTSTSASLSSSLPGTGYGHSTSSSSSVSASSSSVSSSKHLPGTGYGHSTLSSTLSPIPPPGTGYAHPTGSYQPTSSSKTTSTTSSSKQWITGVPSPSPNSTTTGTETTYTTTTVCPVTITTTGASSVYITTKLTTSTLTITSCKGGCHHSAGPTANATSTHAVTTTVPVYVTPTPIVETKTWEVTDVKTITKFVPCSTPVSSSGSQTWYSTFLTISHSESTYVHPTTAYITHAASSTATVTSSPAKSTSTTEESGSGASHSAPAGQPSSPAQGSETCVAKTIYSTVTVTASDSNPAPTACSTCHTEKVTVTLANGSKTILTITSTPTSTPGSTFKPGHSHSWSAPGQSSGAAQPTGTGKIYPTGGHAAPSGHAPHGTGSGYGPKPTGYAKSW